MKPLNYSEIKTDIGCRCFLLPGNWSIFCSLTNPHARYVNTGRKWLKFESEKAIYEYSDSLKDFEDLEDFDTPEQKEAAKTIILLGTLKEICYLNKHDTFNKCDEFMRQFNLRVPHSHEIINY